MCGQTTQELVDGAGIGDCADADDMDTALGHWLYHTGSRLVRRSRQNRGLGRVVRPAELWRCLVTIWCMSPEVRQRYSDESRNGLLTAAATMDDETFGSLVRGLLLEVEKAQTAEARLPR